MKRVWLFNWLSDVIKFILCTYLTTEHRIFSLVDPCLWKYKLCTRNRMGRQKNYAWPLAWLRNSKLFQVELVRRRQQTKGISHSKLQTYLIGTLWGRFAYCVLQNMLYRHHVWKLLEKKWSVLANDNQWPGVHSRFRINKSELCVM